MDASNQKESYLDIIKQAVSRTVREFDTLFAILFVVSYISPTLSTLFRVNTIPTTVILFGLWALTFCINTFVVQKIDGGVGGFVKKALADRPWELACILVWLVLLAVNALLKRGVNGHISFSYYTIFFAIFFMDLCYATTGDTWKRKYIIYAALGTFTIECLRSLVILLGEKDGAWIARQLANSTVYTTEQRNAFMLRGLGGYEFFTGLSIATGAFMLYILKAKKRVPLVIMFVICMLTLFMSGYTFPVMFACLAMGIALLYALRKFQKKSSERRLIIRTVSLVVASFSIMLALGRPLNIGPSVIYLNKARNVYNRTIKPLFQKEEVPLPGEGDGGEIAQDPVMDLVDIVPPDGFVSDGQVQIRMLLYKTSWITFTENWAFGVGPYINTWQTGIGGHSTWLDYLAMYGALQFCFFIAFVLLMFRRVRKNTGATERVFRTLAFGILLLYGFINPIISYKVFPFVMCLLIGGNLPPDKVGYAALPKAKK